MNLKSRIATVATASLFALSMGTGALAQDATTETASDNTVTQQINPNQGDGAFTASITGATFAPVNFSFTDTTTEGNTLVLTVTDNRGTFEGWNVAISAGPFSNQDEGSDTSFSSENLYVTSFGEPTVESPNTDSDGLTPGAGGHLNDLRTALWAAAGNGSGTFDQVITADMTVPGQTQVGTYVSTLTVELKSGPVTMVGE